jgi:ribosome-binding protein aMBF1 (putative translation factor)
MSTQDWETVVIRNPARAKKTVQERKPAGGEAQRLYKLETTEEAPKKKRLTRESRQDLQVARTAIKKSQKDVDKELAFPVNSVRDFEAGTMAPSGKQISDLHRYFAASKLTLKVEMY